MELNPANARAALLLAEAAERRSSTLRGYQHASPHLILWGGLYALAYGWGFFRPAEAGPIWAVVTPCGVAASYVLGRRSDCGTEIARNYLGVVVIFTALITATAAVMRPIHPNQMAAFIPLLIAALYALFGLRVGLRFMALGIALGGLTLIGYFSFPAIFLLWMAVVGGGALMLAGLWLRQP